MFFLFQYKKNGLPYGLIKLHQFLLEDIISYFEKGKSIKDKINEIGITLRQAVRFARDKKIYPSLKTNQAVELFEDVYKELEITHKVLKEAAAEMETMINQIKEERVINIHSLVLEAQEYFKEKEIDTGIKLLQKAQKELKEKLLIKTRKKIFAGYESELKKISHEIEKEKSIKKNKSVKFFSMSIPWSEYSSYRIARNFFYRFSELINY